MKKILSIILAMIILTAAAACMAEDGITVPVITEMKRFDIPDNEAMRFMRELKTRPISEVPMSINCS